MPAPISIFVLLLYLIIYFFCKFLFQFFFFIFSFELHLVRKKKMEKSVCRGVKISYKDINSKLLFFLCFSSFLLPQVLCVVSAPGRNATSWRLVAGFGRMKDVSIQSIHRMPQSTATFDCHPHSGLVGDCLIGHHTTDRL